jgi:hypothetical protein
MFSCCSPNLLFDFAYFALAPVCACDVLTVMHNNYLYVKTGGNAEVVGLAVKKTLLCFRERKRGDIR